MTTFVTSSVADLARGLKERCETISGLRCYDVMSPKPEPPAVCVTGPVRWTYDETFEGTWRPVFELWLYVHPANLVEAQRQLFAYVAPTGPKSIPAAICGSPDPDDPDGDPSLGGRAHTTRLLGGPRGASVVETAGGSLLGLALEVEVWAM